MRRILSTVFRNLLAHSPRVYCESCHNIFLLGQMQVDVSITSGLKDKCPRCGSGGPFRPPTDQELAVAVPESQRQWPLALAIGIGSMLVIAYIWWRS
jgi:ribosomal protein S27AE